VPRVAQDERVARARRHDELEAEQTRCDREKRHGAIGVRARGNFAFPFAEVEDLRRALPVDAGTTIITAATISGTFAPADGKPLEGLPAIFRVVAVIRPTTDSISYIGRVTR
jgi:hypothetical protein